MVHRGCGYAYIVILAVVVLGAASTRSFGAEDAIFTKHFASTLFEITRNKEYSVEVLRDDREYPISRNTVGIVVHDRHDEDVDSAKLTITVEQAGGVSQALPAVKDKGDGLYEVTGLDLNRQGAWRLRITVKKAEKTDEAIFEFPEAAQRAKAAGRY